MVRLNIKVNICVMKSYSFLHHLSNTVPPCLVPTAYSISVIQREKSNLSNTPNFTQPKTQRPFLIPTKYGWNCFIFLLSKISAENTLVQSQNLFQEEITFTQLFCLSLAFCIPLIRGVPFTKVVKVQSTPSGPVIFHVEPLVLPQFHLYSYILSVVALSIFRS